MTVEELIAELKKYPADMQVVTSGYEGGVTEAKEVTQCQVALNVHPDEWYYGEHEPLVDYYVEKYADRQKQQMVRIVGERH